MTTKEHFALLDKQVAIHDRQIAATRALIHEGMKMVIESRKAQRQTQKNLGELITALTRGTKRQALRYR